jgi:hypothetical protein
MNWDQMIPHIDYDNYPFITTVYIKVIDPLVNYVMPSYSTFYKRTVVKGFVPITIPKENRIIHDSIRS